MIAAPACLSDRSTFASPTRLRGQRTGRRWLLDGRHAELRKLDALVESLSDGFNRKK
jgi:hypothetical protein